MTKPKIDLGLEIRKEVLATSLVVEGLTSAFLSSLLGIKDYTNSRTLGNKSSSLSFNNKIDLLIEIGALSKDNRSKFQTFMEIRNQFVHNLSATTYEKCFAETNGKDNFILKAYPQSQSHSRERQLELATSALGNDIVQLTVALTKSVEDKIRKEIDADLYKKTQQAFIKAIDEIKITLDDYFENEIEKSPTFSTKRLKGFGTQLSKLFYKLSIKNLQTLNKKEDDTTSNKIVTKT